MWNENALLSSCYSQHQTGYLAYAEESYLAYAQSYSLIEFLITQNGQDKMLELVTTFSEGNSYDDALEKVYGFDTDGLDTLWQDYIKKQHQEAKFSALTSLPLVC